jgi:hypothetical protein
MTEDPLSFQIINADSNNKETIIAEILSIQDSLLIPLNTAQIHTLTQTNFIIIHRSSQYLLKLLEKGIFIVAYYQKQMVGYLLLDEIDGYIKWAQGRRFDGKQSIDSLGSVKYIDQVAVLTSFEQKGIETALINHAKECSPTGIMTDILAKPFPNLSSMNLFQNNGFVNLGTLYIEATNALQAHQVVLMLWLL